MPHYKSETELRQADFSGRAIHELSDVEKQELNRRFNEFVRAMKGQIPGGGKAVEQAEKPKPTLRKWTPGTTGRRR